MFEATDPGAPTAVLTRQQRSDAADAIVAQALVDGPSAETVTALCGVPTKQLSASGRLDYIRAWEQVTAWASAQAMPVVVDHVGPDALDEQNHTHPAGDIAAIEHDSLVEEIRLALTLSPVATKARVELARELCGPLPRTLTELESGRISLMHARAMVEAVRPLDDDLKGIAEKRALERAGHGTPGEFRKACRAVVDLLEPEATRRRHQAARDLRSVRKWELPDGMGCLHVEAPAPDIDTIHSALSVLAGPGDTEDPRSLDARRTDALLGLCLGAVAPDPETAADSPNKVVARPTIPVQAHIVVDLATVMNLANNPAQLLGYGPIPAGLARDWLQDATTWRRLVTDPIEGHLLDYGPTVRSAPPKLREYLNARHHTCVFPGCNRQARRSDLDHEPPWKPDGTGGHTSANDLRPLCRRHHNFKTLQMWTMTHDGPHGTKWSSPSYKEWTRPPPPILDDD